MGLNSLHELYIEGLQDLYSAEHQILRALPKLELAATNPQVKGAFAAHRAQTEEHIARLERICTELDVSPKGKHCKGMEGPVADAAELMSEDADPDVMDAGLISSAQPVEHYEMAGYGILRTYAQLQGYTKQAHLLPQALDEEHATDLLLTDITLSVNVDAVVAGDEDATDKRLL